MCVVCVVVYVCGIMCVWWYCGVYMWSVRSVYVCRPVLEWCHVGCVIIMCCACVLCAYVCRGPI